MSSQILSRADETQPAANGKARYQSVLLIDDHSLDNLINKKLIESTGFSDNVTTYQDAAEALTHLRTCQMNELPEVIFLDISMPGMDGFQFLEAYGQLPAERRQQTRVIMLSTSDSFKDLNRANKNPTVRKFLIKPLSIQVLQAIHV